MGCSKTLAFLVLLLGSLICFLLPISMAYDFYVGGREGWVSNPGESYSSWAGRNRFQVGDKLVFKYKKGEDSVLVVSKANYESCNVSSPIQKLDGGDSVFVFGRSGPFFFISGAPGKCSQGQRLVVVVLAERDRKPSPSPPIVTPPSSSPSSPSPSSSPASSPSPSAFSPVSSPSPAAFSPVSSPSLSPSTSSPVSSPSPLLSPSVSPATSPSSSPSPSPISPPSPFSSPPPATTAPATPPISPASSSSPPTNAPGESASPETSPRPGPSSSPALTASVVSFALVALAVGSIFLS